MRARHSWWLLSASITVVTAACSTSQTSPPEIHGGTLARTTIAARS